MSNSARTAPPRAPARRISERLHRLRDDIRKEWEAETRHLTGEPDAELQRYRAGYEADFRGVWHAGTVENLLAAVAGADIVFSGDHHTLPAAQRLPIRLLRRLDPGDRPVALALEMLHSKDQRAVDAFLAGRLAAEALREAIAFDRRWGFDWLAYLPLLEYARRHGHPVLAINSDPGPVRGRLRRRDAHAAERIVRRLAAHPGERLFVLAGDWHVARAHLPRAVALRADRIGRVWRTVIVHQNHDALYRRFARLEGMPPPVARRGRGTFCVFNATPLTKVSAQRHWSGRQPLHSLYGDDGTTDAAAAFHDIVGALARHLGLPNALDRLTIWQIDDPEDALGALETHGVRSRTLRRRLLGGEPVYLAGRGALLLPHASLNRLGEEAARQLGARWPGFRARDAEALFFGAAVRAGAQFFASRLLNPNRKCPLLADLARERHSGTDFTAAWALRLQCPRGSGRLPARHPFWRAAASTHRRVARRIGVAWGYHLYDAYIQERLDLAYIRSLFETPTSRSAPEMNFHYGWCAWRSLPRVNSRRDLL